MRKALIGIASMLVLGITSIDTASAHYGYRHHGVFYRHHHHARFFGGFGVAPAYGYGWGCPGYGYGYAAAPVGFGIGVGFGPRWGRW
jgi:hypothetical protein